MDTNTESSKQFRYVNSRDIEAVHKQFELDGKRPSTSSNGDFLKTAVVGIPVFLSLLPISIAYQLGKSIIQPTASSDAALDDPRFASREESTEEIFPALDEITPKHERKYDIVVLGCTGFTGRLAALYIARTYQVNDKVKWAIAGRSQTKLDKLKEELSSIVSNTQELDTIIVDTTKPSSMHGLVKDTRAVVTTAGPFWKYGSKVVEFCAKYGTDYVDTTGEVGWNKEMIMKWNKKAVQTGSKIISFCGCDSIPWDLTYYKLSQLVNNDVDKKGSDNDYLVKVDFFDELKGGVSGGTIDTFVSLAVDQSYKEARYDYDPYYKSVDGKKIIHKTKDTSPATPKPSIKGDGKWTIPWLMGMVNMEVVKRSNALLNGPDDVPTQKNLQYQEFWVQPSFKEAFINWFGAVVGVTALLNPISGTPVRKYMLPKPGQGPPDKLMTKGYLMVTAQGQSKNGKRVESSLYFPNDAGYADTARMVVESGLTLALDADKLPTKGGGFYTPAIGMGDALLERLCMTGCKFASRVIGTNDDGGLKSKL